MPCNYEKDINFPKIETENKKYKGNKEKYVEDVFGV